jgi:hypothetical protein
MPGTKPIKKRIYPFPKATHEKINEHVRGWVKLSIAKPSYSPWASPCILVDKKDQHLGRCCGDLRGPNGVTVDDAYPIRQIEDQKAEFTGCIFFACIDLKDAYLQVELDEESKEITAIITTEGLFEFNRMIQGLKTAPATFHRIILMTHLKKSFQNF